MDAPLKLLLPQQATVPSVRRPQVCWAPAEICVKVPEGGLAWPDELSPQHSTEPSDVIPQVWLAYVSL